MKNDFDKKIKGLLDDANLSDTGFSLDKDAVWNKINSKKNAKVIPFRKWISHAAAMIIGVLICLPFLYHSKKETEQIVTVTKTIAAPAQVIRDTVFVENKRNAIAEKTFKNVSQKHLPYTDETIAQKALQPVSNDKNTINPNADIETNQPEPTVAIAAKHKLGVLHLLDIENENALPKKKKQPDNYVLFKKITIPYLPNDNSETISMLIVKPSSR